MASRPHDRVELFAVFSGAGLYVRLAHLVGFIGEDLVHALADVPPRFEVDVFLGFLPLVNEGGSYGSRRGVFCFTADCPPGELR
ncbi:hypothetical protein [Streptomyces sp. NPDC048825]|uniref:hypothetical protein n=1 Tax=Streptomyces sp. NPDC048825 TaxID=3365592 RepID=UPI00371AA8D2